MSTTYRFADPGRPLPAYRQKKQADALPPPECRRVSKSAVTKSKSLSLIYPPPPLVKSLHPGTKRILSPPEEVSMPSGKLLYLGFRA